MNGFNWFTAEWLKLYYILRYLNNYRSRLDAGDTRPHSMAKCEGGLHTAVDGNMLNDDDNNPRQHSGKLIVFIKINVSAVK